MKRVLGAAILALLGSPAVAQSGDPGGMVFAFVQSGPAGCPAPGATDAPAFDPNFFAGCWMPPSLCPPLEVAAENGSRIVLPFERVQPGAPGLLLASPISSMPLIAPCHWAGHHVLGIVSGDASGRARFDILLPVVRLTLVGVIPIAQVQLVVLDTSGASSQPVLATSRVIQVEGRF